MKKLGYLFCFCLLVSSCAVQTVVVKGTVYDENDAPLPFCTVYTSRRNGVVVDLSGEYSIAVPNKGKTMIHFASLGYKDLDITYAPGDSDDVLDVKMQLDSVLLEETIIEDWFGSSR